MGTAEHRTELGALFARLEWGRQVNGDYLVEGYTIRKWTRRRWILDYYDGTTWRSHITYTLTDAVRFVADLVDRDAS